MFYDDIPDDYPYVDDIVIRETIEMLIGKAKEHGTNAGMIQVISMWISLGETELQRLTAEKFESASLRNSSTSLRNSKIAFRVSVLAIAIAVAVGGITAIFSWLDYKSDKKWQVDQLAKLEEIKIIAADQLNVLEENKMQAQTP